MLTQREATCEALGGGALAPASSDFDELEDDDLGSVSNQCPNASANTKKKLNLLKSPFETRGIGEIL